MSIVKIGKALLQGVYTLHKAAPVRKNRVSIISRQSNTPGLDIALLREALLRENGGVDVQVLCKTLDPGIGGIARYFFHLIGPQMHLLATSGVVVLDGYCIGASTLHHKRSLYIIQMWHAMGAFKKFGRSILGQSEGASGALAEQMDMHRNYDLILASSEACIPALAEAFGYPEERFCIMPLPRMNLLQDEAYMQARKKDILSRHPELEGKEVLLYAPTFRKQSFDEAAIADLARAAGSRENFALVLAPHPKMDVAAVPDGVVFDPHFTTLEWLSVCDSFITDYSAVTFDAAAMNKPLYFYAPDIGSYEAGRGFYLDYQHDLPTVPRASAEELVQDIADRVCEPAAVAAFRDRYIAPGSDWAGQFARLILSHLDDASRG